MELLTSPIDIQLHGRRHTGLYAVHNDMLTVWNRGMGSRSVALAGRDVARTARRLLIELVVTARPSAALPPDPQTSGQSTP